MLTQRIEFPVTLSDDHKYTVVGYLSTQAGGGRGPLKSRTLQVVVHGGTYDHEYWDASTLHGVDYSYARHMAERGYAVLALDMLGTGESSQPPGDFVNLAESSGAIAQILAQVREPGHPCAHTFDKVALIGHSIGTITSIYSLGRHGPLVDALVATGWAHVPRVIPVDPSAFEQPLQRASVVFPADFRTRLFYHLPTTDPAIIQYDNDHLANGLPRALMLDVVGLMTALGIGDPAQIKAASLVDRVAVPVLVQLGQYDLIAPSSLAAQEGSFFGASPGVTVQTLADIGHDFNLHLNHLSSWHKIDAWLAATLGG